MNIQSIPAELREKKQWITWKFKEVRDEVGNVRRTKVPLKPNGRENAGSNRPEDWGFFDECHATLEVGRVDGIGFVFNSDYIGIDLDHVFYVEGDNAGQLKPLAKEILAHYDSYTEYSPTRINGIPKGVHIYLRSTGVPAIDGKRGAVEKVENGKNAMEVEVYNTKRFFTVTGDVFEGRTDIKDVNPEFFMEWRKKTFPEKTPQQSPKITSSSNLPSDDVIIARMRGSRNGRKFSALFDRGDYKSLGFPSGSEALFSLASMVMFFTRNDEDATERIMRRSALEKPKWDTLRNGITYLRSEIAKCLQANVIDWNDPASDYKDDILQDIRLFGDITVIQNDIGYVVKSPVHNGIVHFTFTELSTTRQSTDAILSVQIFPVDDQPSTPYELRIDTRSQSQQSALVTSLNKAFGDSKKGGYNWALIVNAACSALAKRMETDQKVVKFSADTPFTQPTFLFYPFLQKDATNMYFASSETGKSWTALYTAICMATGREMLGYEAPTGINSLYIDYEDAPDIFLSRMKRVCAALDIPMEEVVRHVFYYKPLGSVRDSIEAIRRMISEENISLITVDAGGDAAGGSPNDEQKVIEMFNALDTLPCTRLIIHHEPKDVSNRTDENAFYGSMYWRGRSRVAWRLVKVNEDNEGATIKMSLAKKSNLGHIDAIYYKIKHETIADAEFEGHEVPWTSITQVDKPVNPEREDDRATVLKLLTEEGVKLTQLTAGTGISKITIWRILKDLEKEGLSSMTGERRGALWHLTEAGRGELDSRF